MTEDLLHYYKNERSFLREDAREFARSHPDVAERLRMGADSADPHVERLIEAFAFLTARIHRRLDDDFPELTDALLSVLYPHYLAPIPSMAVVQFTLDAAHTADYPIGRGRALMSERISRGPQCAFRTTQDVTLWPIDVSSASIGPVELPPDLPGYTPPATAQAMVRLELSCMSKDLTFEKLGVSDLRFFLDGERSFLLYELLLNNVVDVIACDPRGTTNPRNWKLQRIARPGGCITAGGFSEAEAMLPYPLRSFPGYRLLTEYFAFPEKFLFLDVHGLGDGNIAASGNTLVLYVLLDRAAPRELGRDVNRETFRLGCTPIINLFEHEADSFKLTHAQTEYLVTPDARMPGASEVYSIDSVLAMPPGGGSRPVEYRPFFAPAHSAARNGDAAERFWYSRRTPSPTGDGTTDVFISFVDLDFEPAISDGWTVKVSTTCFNRDHRLPFGGDQPRLQLAQGDAPLRSLRCLTAPTAALRRPGGRGAMWRLISHLNLNHLSLTDEQPEIAAASLREILSLYDPIDSELSRARVAALQGIHCSRAVFPVPGERGAFCRGLEATLEFDEKRFSDNGLFLLAAVLERFLGLYCSINSAVQTVAMIGEPRKLLRRWPARSGERVLL